jgi:hypothetical protein
VAGASPVAHRIGGAFRTVAEEVLMRRRENGSYLVRDSETIKGASVLSVLYVFARLRTASHLEDHHRRSLSPAASTMSSITTA